MSIAFEPYSTSKHDVNYVMCPISGMPAKHTFRKKRENKFDTFGSSL